MIDHLKQQNELEGFCAPLFPADGEDGKSNTRSSSYSVKL